MEEVNALQRFVWSGISIPWRDINCNQRGSRVECIRHSTRMALHTWINRPLTWISFHLWLMFCLSLSFCRWTGGETIKSERKFVLMVSPTPTRGPGKSIRTTWRQQPVPRKHLFLCNCLDRNVSNHQPSDREEQNQQVNQRERCVLGSNILFLLSSLEWSWKPAGCLATASCDSLHLYVWPICRWRTTMTVFTINLN